MATIIVTDMTGGETVYDDAHIEFPAAEHINDPSQQEHLSNPGWWSLVISKGNAHNDAEERLAIYTAGKWTKARVV